MCFSGLCISFLVSTDSPASSLGRRLTAYFRSGWAFFIPYLAVYLIYSWRQWPANASHKVSVANGPIEATHRLSSFLPSLTPIPLLYVYWALHVINAVLAAIAFLAWWKHSNRETLGDQLNDGLSLEASEHSAPGSLSTTADLTARHPQLVRSYITLRSASAAVAPWFFLALLFYIPGVYLEWPADPWAHFRWITEWATHDFAGSHSAGYKSLYFFAYTFVARIPAGRQLFCLNIYYTCMCLLLAWQYYLLAKAVGLSPRWAFLSVIVNVLMFGNVCFSFYRYYGLASTIFAQIGAVALTRVTILAVRMAKCVESKLWICETARSSFRRERSLDKARSTLILLLSSSVLLALIAFSHVQGLGIVGLSIGSVVVWRLIEWKHSTMFFLIGGALVLSAAAILWWPRDPLIGSEYRPIGWLNVWYGFNLFAWPSPAAERGLQILGLLGVLNLAAGIALLWRNHVVGWLTVGPLIALGLPFLAIPFCDALARNGEPIFVFHRLLFAIPSGLSLTYLAATAAHAWEIRVKRRAASGRSSPGVQLLRFGAGLAAVAALVLIPSTRLCFNRLWNSLAIQADDLDMAAIGKVSGDLQYNTNSQVEKILCAPGPGFVLLVNGVPNNAYGSDRFVDPASQPSARAEMIMRLIRDVPNDRISGLLVVPQTRILTSAQSMAAFLSKQWLPNEVALECAGGPEYEAAALDSGYRKIPLLDVSLYLYQPLRKAN